MDKDGGPLPADKRRKWCDVPANVADMEFSTDHVYTFQWWQHFFDLSQYKVGVCDGGLCLFVIDWVKQGSPARRSFPTSRHNPPPPRVHGAPLLQSRCAPSCAPSFS